MNISTISKCLKYPDCLNQEQLYFLFDYQDDEDIDYLKIYYHLDDLNLYIPIFSVRDTIFVYAADNFIPFSQYSQVFRIKKDLFLNEYRRRKKSIADSKVSLDDIVQDKIYFKNQVIDSLTDFRMEMYKYG